MTKDEVDRYWFPACKVIWTVKRRHFTDTPASRALAQIVGVPYPYPCYWEKIDMTPALKRKLETILSPHYWILRKVEQIRRSDDTSKSGEDIQKTG